MLHHSPEVSNVQHIKKHIDSEADDSTYIKQTDTLAFPTSTSLKSAKPLNTHFPQAQEVSNFNKSFSNSQLDADQKSQFIQKGLLGMHSQVCFYEEFFLFFLFVGNSS